MNVYYVEEREEVDNGPGWYVRPKGLSRIGEGPFPNLKDALDFANVEHVTSPCTSAQLDPIISSDHTVRRHLIETYHWIRDRVRWRKHARADSSV